jgi:hypothetical protein
VRGETTTEAVAVAAPEPVLLRLTDAIGPPPPVVEGVIVELDQDIGIPDISDPVIELHGPVPVIIVV